MRFKILPKVDGFRLKGVMHKPGDIVDLPESYAGESWLQRVEPEIVAAAPIPKLEPIAKVEEAKISSFSSLERKQRKKLKS